MEFRKIGFVRSILSVAVRMKLYSKNKARLPKEEAMHGSGLMGGIYMWPCSKKLYPRVALFNSEWR